MCNLKCNFGYQCVTLFYMDKISGFSGKDIQRTVLGNTFIRMAELSMMGLGHHDQGGTSNHR